MNKFEHWNYLASKAKETCDPSKYSSLYGEGKCAELNRKNNETFKANNGQYPARLFK